MGDPHHAPRPLRSTPRRVGQFPTKQGAAAALAQDRSVLSQLHNDAVFSIDEVMQRVRWKNELYAILGYLTDEAWSFIAQKRSELAESSQLGDERFAHTMFHPLRSSVDIEALAEQIANGVPGMHRSAAMFDYFDALTFHRTPPREPGENEQLITEFCHSIEDDASYAPVLKRVVYLMEKIDMPVYEQLLNKGSPAKIVTSLIALGLNTSTSQSFTLLRALPLVVAQSNPDVTCDEMVVIARNSKGLLRALAGLNLRQMDAVLATLSVPPDAEVSHVSSSLRDQEIIDTAHLRYDPEKNAVQFAQRLDELPLIDLDTYSHAPHHSVDPDGDATTVGEIHHDASNIPLRGGCPARLEVYRGAASPVEKSWMEAIEHVEDLWRVSLPSRTPLKLEIEGTQPYTEIELEDIPAHLRVLPSVSGSVSCEVSDEAAGELLSVQGDGGVLTVASQAHAPVEERQMPQITLRIPVQDDMNVTARGVSSLEVEIPSTLYAEVPRGGKLRADVPAPHLCRVRADEDSDVLVICDKFASAMCFSPENSRAQRSSTVISRDNARLPAGWPDTTEYLSLKHMASTRFSNLPGEQKRIVGENLEFLTRHWGRDIESHAKLHRAATQYAELLRVSPQGMHSASPPQEATLMWYETPAAVVRDSLASPKR